MGPRRKARAIQDAEGEVGSRRLRRALDDPEETLGEGNRTKRRKKRLEPSLTIPPKSLRRVENGLNSAETPGRSDEPAKMREASAGANGSFNGQAPAVEEGKAEGMRGRPGRTGSECVEALADGVLRTPTDGPRAAPLNLSGNWYRPANHPPFGRFSNRSLTANLAATLAFKDRTERPRSVWGDAPLSPVSHSLATHFQPRERLCGASEEASPFRPARPRRNRAAKIRKGAGQTRHTFCRTGWVRDAAFPTTQFSAQRDGPGKAKERAQ